MSLPGPIQRLSYIYMGEIQPSLEHESCHDQRQTHGRGAGAGQATNVGPNKVRMWKLLMLLLSSH